MTKYVVWRQFYTKDGRPKLRAHVASCWDEGKANALRASVTDLPRAEGVIEPVEVPGSIADLDRLAKAQVAA